jgi:preprotein translocase subunit SecF
MKWLENTKWFEEHYKKLMIIPWALIIISILLIGSNVIQTGEFVNKGVSLSGGVSTTMQANGDIGTSQVESAFRAEFPQADVSVRQLTGDFTYVIEASSIAEDEQESASLLEEHLQNQYSPRSLSTETTGPALGDAFFAQTAMGIMLAFLWMGWVVYLYFGNKLSIKLLAALIALMATISVTSGLLTGPAGMAILFGVILLHLVAYLYLSVPSGAVILAAASTVLFTLAVIDLIGMRLQTAGVAAFLMLIGYSVDTDILVSTRVLKTQDGTIMSRIVGAFKTGITMQITTTIVTLVAYLATNSAVIEQIMLILFIGMIGDMIFTWLQNAGILYWYAKRIGVKER